VTGATTADACDTETCPPGSQVPPPPSSSSTPAFVLSNLVLGLIAGASAIVLGVVIFFFCCRKKGNGEEREGKSSGLARREQYDVELSYPEEGPSPSYRQYPAPVHYSSEPEQYPEYPEAWEVDSRFPHGSPPPPPPHRGSPPSASPGKRNLALAAARVQPRILAPATTRLSGGSTDRSPRVSLEDRNSGGGRGPGRIVYR
jgi:hypothetical protein